MKRQPKDLGQRMLAARESRDLSQEQLAEKLGAGADATQVSRWESGERTPRAETLALFCSALAIDGHWLLTGEGSMVRVTELMPLQLDVVGKIAGGFVTKHDLDSLRPLVRLTERKIKDAADREAQLVAERAERAASIAPKPKAKRKRANGA